VAWCLHVLASPFHACPADRIAVQQPFPRPMSAGVEGLSHHCDLILRK
jgi:hypothetical protein